jgi:hypothetical protein
MSRLHVLLASRMLCTTRYESGSKTQADAWALDYSTVSYFPLPYLLKL